MNGQTDSGQTGRVARPLPEGYELNEHGLPVPTLRTLQNVLGQAKNMNDFFGRDGLLAQLFKTTIESAMEAEMDGTLGYPKHMKTGTVNHRNGHNKKQLKTSIGPVQIAVPRDRQAEYEPQIVKKHQTRANDLEEKIIAMYAYGNTTRDIQSQLEEMYGIEVSPEYISNAVDKISPLVREWYTTNILENLNRHFRKLTKNRLIFPNDESALKALFLGIERLSERWTAPVHDWGKILNQLAIHFDGRI